MGKTMEYYSGESERTISGHSDHLFTILMEDKSSGWSDSSIKIWSISSGDCDRSFIHTDQLNSVI
jgi:WD40 repeat protein